MAPLRPRPVMAIMIALAAFVVVAQGQGDAPNSEEGGAPPNAEASANKLAEIKCEIAVSSLNSKLIDMQAKFTQAGEEKKKALEEHVQAKQAYEAAKKAGASEEAMSFGTAYLKLRNRMKELEQRDAKDNQYKLKFVSLKKQVPLLKNELNATKFQRQLLDEKIARFEKDQTAQQDEAQVVEKKLAALEKQLPYAEETISNRYAPHVIPARAKRAQLKLQSIEEVKRSQDDEAQLIPLAKSLKTLTGELDGAKEVLSNSKSTVRATQMRTIAAVRSSQHQLAQLHEEQLSDQNKLDTLHLDFQEKQHAAKEKEEEAAEAAKAALDAKKLAEETKDEKEIEQAEEPEVEISPEVKAARELHDDLTAQLQALQSKVNARLASEEERAAQELEAVKVTYRKKLEAEKIANGEKIVLKGPESDELEQRKQEIEQEAREMRKSVPPIEIELTPQSL